MADTPGSFVECVDEPYEVQAIRAFIAGHLRIADLQASLGRSKSQAYKLVARFKADGADGLTSKKTGNQNRAFDPERRAMVLNLLRDHYPEFGPTFALEKLEANHGITIGLETLRQWMKEAGIWVDRAGRKPRIFSSRQRRPRRGELIQVDGSYHRWFEKRGKEGCLLVFIDDATSEIMELRLVDTESSFNYMASLKRYIERFGCPQAVYSDRHSIFRSPHENAEGERTTTQFARACMRLGINVICAKTPQAKGRVERSNRTFQDRLVRELRLRGISTFDEANAYLSEYRLAHNAKFAKPPADAHDAHSPSPNRNLNELLTFRAHSPVQNGAGFLPGRLVWIAMHLLMFLLGEESQAS